MKSLGIKSVTQRAVDKNPIGMQSLGMILFGPFGIFFQETVPLYASTKNLSLIHSSPPPQLEHRGWLRAHVTLQLLTHGIHILLRPDIRGLEISPMLPAIPIYFTAYQIIANADR